MKGFPPDAFHELGNSVSHLIAIVRCLNLSLEDKGTKSERMVARVKVVTTSLGEPPEEIVLNRYTQSDYYLKQGKLYVITAYLEGLEYYYLTGWNQVGEDIAPAALEQVTQAYGQYYRDGDLKHKD